MSTDRWSDWLGSWDQTDTPLVPSNLFKSELLTAGLSQYLTLQGLLPSSIWTTEASQENFVLYTQQVISSLFCLDRLGRLGHPGVGSFNQLGFVTNKSLTSTAKWSKLSPWTTVGSPGLLIQQVLQSSTLIEDWSTYSNWKYRRKRRLDCSSHLIPL